MSSHRPSIISVKIPVSYFPANMNATNMNTNMSTICINNKLANMVQAPSQSRKEELL